MPRIIFVLCLVSLLTGCYEEQLQNQHGLSKLPVTQFTYRGVVDRSIKLHFKVDKDDVTKIIALIESQTDYNFPLNFEWKLGEGVTLNSGKLTGQIEKLEKGSALEIELNVNGFSNDVKRFVRFEVLGTNPQKRAFADGIVSSQDKSFEKIVQEIELYKKSNP